MVALTLEGRINLTLGVCVSLPTLGVEDVPTVCESGIALVILGGLKSAITDGADRSDDRDDLDLDAEEVDDGDEIEFADAE